MVSVRLLVLCLTLTALIPASSQYPLGSHYAPAYARAGRYRSASSYGLASAYGGGYPLHRGLGSHYGYRRKQFIGAGKIGHEAYYLKKVKKTAKAALAIKKAHLKALHTLSRHAHYGAQAAASGLHGLHGLQYGLGSAYGGLPYGGQSGALLNSGLALGGYGGHGAGLGHGYASSAVHGVY